MDKNEPFVRNEVDDVTPKKPDESASASSLHGSDETPKQSTQSNQTDQGSPLVPLQESPNVKDEFPKLTGTIQSKKDLRTAYLKAPKATHGSMPKQSPQINKTFPMGQSSLHLQLQESHLSNSTTTHGSSPKPDLSSLSTTTATQEPSASAEPGSAHTRYRIRLPVFKELCSGVEFQWYGPQEPDLPSSSGKGTMPANSPCAPKVSAEPFTLSTSSPPRQASEQLSCDHQNSGDDSRTSEVAYPKLSIERQRKKDLRSAHLKTPTATHSNTTTTTTHGSTPSVDVPGTVTQEPDMSSASDDKRQDDEITAPDQDHSALDDNL
ncbi:unnamed protein product [Arabidopsis lyrata]|uniref:Uncharacterized protein n=1 Tax=Arabidopsis lyrata subsp. lyrata TaxID=81972 RepID=D7KQ79_ARALL|nr:uncharacterized protein LOC9328129 isoform X2 [Arabidopsis lyrata subsp. lyrata]EFH65629.1 hypothetical protein ARALYDRAFT_333518 [Arabidopsis lyrata subsp. lyrata]CAH8250845.1 unnamed protein product [Arabidopsis lyrata]|eukprot:XP_002889370.1 uncharacterized protein LOC9328129 isoform X2 [Arabidopsis lyrata subsp. lyrata]